MTFASEANLKPTRFLRCDEVRARYGHIATSALYAWMAAGRFPRPVKIGPRAVAWREADLDEHDRTLRISK